MMPFRSADTIKYNLGKMKSTISAEFSHALWDKPNKFKKQKAHFQFSFEQLIERDLYAHNKTQLSVAA